MTDKIADWLDDFEDRFITSPLRLWFSVILYAKLWVLITLLYAKLF